MAAPVSVPAAKAAGQQASQKSGVSPAAPIGPLNMSGKSAPGGNTVASKAAGNLVNKGINKLAGGDVSAFKGGLKQALSGDLKGGAKTALRTAASIGSNRLLFWIAGALGFTLIGLVVTFIVWNGILIASWLLKFPIEKWQKWLILGLDLVILLVLLLLFFVIFMGYCNSPAKLALGILQTDECTNFRLWNVVVWMRHVV